MAVGLYQLGEEARSPTVLNRPWQQLFAQSGYAVDGSDFAGFAKVGAAATIFPLVIGEVAPLNFNYPVCHVRRYGALGNNVANDTVAFQNAYLTAAALGRKIIFADDGTFKITTGLVPPTGTALQGLGMFQTILNITVAGGIGFYTQNKTNVAIRDVGIIGSMSMAFVFQTSTNCAVQRCAVTGCTDSTHGTGYAGGIHAWVCDDMEFSDNYCYGNGYLSINPASADIQINGNGNNVGSLRIRILRNRCMSVNAQANIAAYDIQRSEVVGNIATGAKTGASNNNGYGIMLYRTAVANSGVAEHNRVENNYVYAVGGTGIYIQSNPKTVVCGNIVYDAGLVQDDASLAVGGISINGSPGCTVGVNILLECGKASIVVAGQTAPDITGVVVSGNRGLSAVAGMYHILIRGAATNCIFSGNAFKGGSRGVGSFPVPQGAVNCSVDNNVIDGATARGIDIYGISYSSVSGNVIVRTGGNGLALVGGSHDRIAGNTIFDGGTTITNTYVAIELSSTLDSLITGNVVGNSGAVGFKWGLFIPANCTGCVVVLNRAKDLLTASYVVDQTVCAFWGNYDAGASFPLLFSAQQQAVLRGAPGSGLQWLLGDSSVYSSLGVRGNGNTDAFLAQNASQIMGGDSWHQSGAGSASKLLSLRINGDLEFNSTPAATADALYAAFWGVPKVALMATGGVKVLGNQVLATRQAAIPDTAGATLAALETEVNKLKAMVRLHGLMA